MGTVTHSLTIVCNLVVKNMTRYRNPQRVLECLQRALKLADICTVTDPSNITLFVEILDRYVYFYERKCPVITDRFVSGLVALVREHLGSSSTSKTVDAASQFRQILSYMERKKTDPETCDLFAPVQF